VGKKTYEKMKMKNLNLKNPYLLAPMHEVNDIAFRILCKKAGASLTYTGLLSPLSKQKLLLNDKPAIQIFAKNKTGIKEFIKKYDKNASLWDFNLGCPSKRAESCGVGSYLHSNIHEIEEILKEMRKSTKKPLTIKLRKSKNTKKIIEIAKNLCDAICIHPRTNDQGYSGSPDIEFARQLKKQTSLPLIYSGDVNESNAQDLLKDFDFLMIGRSAIGNPNIFAKITKSKEIKNPFFEYLKLAKKYNLDFTQIKFQAMNFTKGKEGASKMREKLSRTKTIEEIEKFLIN
jgi:tRNA-dihydrouridine synthase